MRIYEVPVVAKPRMTQRDKWKDRPCVLQYRAFKDALRLSNFAWDPETEMIVFYLPMPQSWSKKKKAEYSNQPHKSKPDLDNILKGIMDATMDSDQHVWTIVAEKRWAYKSGVGIVKL